MCIVRMRAPREDRQASFECFLIPEKLQNLIVSNAELVLSGIIGRSRVHARLRTYCQAGRHVVGGHLGTGLMSVILRGDAGC